MTIHGISLHHQSVTDKNHGLLLVLDKGQEFQKSLRDLDD